RLSLADITILNKMDYRTGSITGRAVALQDQGDKNIYKNQASYQESALYILTSDSVTPNFNHITKYF
ncbi:MAG: hypothetical protein RLZZ184_2141, partial [Cyanobacteriota bacterium]